MSNNLNKILEEYDKRIDDVNYLDVDSLDDIPDGTDTLLNVNIYPDPAFELDSLKVREFIKYVYNQGYTDGKQTRETEKLLTRPDLIIETIAPDTTDVIPFPIKEVIGELVIDPNVYKKVNIYN